MGEALISLVPLCAPTPLPSVAKVEESSVEKFALKGAFLPLGGTVRHECLIMS